MGRRPPAEPAPFEIIPVSLLAAAVYNLICLSFLWFFSMSCFHSGFEITCRLPATGLSLIGLWRLIALFLTAYLGLEAFLDRARRRWSAVFYLAIAAMIGHQWMYLKVEKACLCWTPSYRVPLLIRDLESGNPDTRLHAVWMLGWFGPPSKEAVPHLIRALEDNDSSIRWNIVRILEYIGPDAREAVPVLEKMARDDPEEHIRVHARWVLNRIRK